MAIKQSTLLDREMSKFVESQTRPGETAIEAISSAREESLRLDDHSTNQVTYLGTATTGSAESAAAWKIKKIDESGQGVVITYADGNANYDNVWNDRLTLTYS